MYVHWGTFQKWSSLGGCLALAENALRAENLLVLKGADGSDQLIVGGNDAVTLTIVCIPHPGSVWIMVSASSPDQMIAVQVRDVIRGMVESTPVAQP